MTISPTTYHVINYTETNKSANINNKFAALINETNNQKQQIHANIIANQQYPVKQALQNKPQDAIQANNPYNILAMSGFTTATQTIHHRRENNIGYFIEAAHKAYDRGLEDR